MKTIDFVKKSTIDTFIEIERKSNEKRLSYTEIKTLVKTARELVSVLSSSLTVDQRKDHSDFFKESTEKLKKIENDLQIALTNSLEKKDYKAHFALSNTYKDIVGLKNQLYVPVDLKCLGENIKRLGGRGTVNLV
ncbi:hypothetical protein CEY02_19670 [Bacillus pumilus]|uniref:Uncharacterized protein n=1 Tax=Bacillus pumilus TaxID=1408 RepID=A0A2A5IL16_BACPU|nr:hypothetical protein [Bacillus pumilus]PCK17657.1 hypothetical protein CEY02_19670 [Bacillus pumilus]